MALISHSETMSVPLEPSAVRERVLAWFDPIGRKIVADEPGRLDLKSGSQAKLRLRGGAFIAPVALPTRTVVTMDAAGGATQVTITASDAVGFGAKTGIKRKYGERVEAIVAGLVEALSAPPGT